MKFLADENISQSLIQLLRLAGHDVLDVKDLRKRLSDAQLISLAQDQNRIIITHDKDFLILLKQPKLSFKLIFLKVDSQLKKDMLKVTRFLLKEKIWQKMTNSAIVRLKKNQIQASWD